MTITSQFAEMTSLQKIFWRRLVSLVKFNYCFKFHVNIVTGSELWQFSFIKDWPEIQKSEIRPSELCQISRDWGELEIKVTECCQCYSFYSFLVIKGKGGTIKGKQERKKKGKGKMKGKTKYTRGKRKTMEMRKKSKKKKKSVSKV